MAIRRNDPSSAPARVQGAQRLAPRVAPSPGACAGNQAGPARPDAARADASPRSSPRYDSAIDTSEFFSARNDFGRRVRASDLDASVASVRLHYPHSDAGIFATARTIVRDTVEAPAGTASALLRDRFAQNDVTLVGCVLVQAVVIMFFTMGYRRLAAETQQIANAHLGEWSRNALADNALGRLLARLGGWRRPGAEVPQ